MALKSRSPDYFYLLGSNPISPPYLSTNMHFSTPSISQSPQFYSIIIHLHNTSQQQRRLMADRTHPSRHTRQTQRQVCSGRVWKSRSRDGVMIIPTPLASRAS